jgi:hypothetical protein
MVRYRLVTAVGLVAGVLLASSGCSLLHKAQSGPRSTSSAALATSSAASAKSSAASPATPATVSNISQWTADKLTQAFAAVDAKIGVHPADYIKVNILDTSVLVEAIDPHKRENVDQYTYAGGAGVEVTPVDVSSSDPGAVEESKFKSDTADPAVLVQVINSAVKDSGVEDGHLVSVLYNKFFADQPEPKISATVQGPRATKIVEYDATGHLLRII